MRRVAELGSFGVIAHDTRGVYRAEDRFRAADQQARHSSRHRLCRARDLGSGQRLFARAPPSVFRHVCPEHHLFGARVVRSALYREFSIGASFQEPVL